MVTTGAKGSIVNQSQVTCALGQQALEGRRVPRLASGRTLPSFAPYDVNPRADGFVMDRFLTGIRPQEYYFHCMAGREGLVDTAVKTSRSGYLQRCLVKHLEELKICYDFTVRNGEGGVVQFLYGEDALDPTKASYLDCSDASFAYIARNYESLKRQNAALPEASVDASSDIAARAHALARATGVYKFKVGDFVKARKLRTGDKWKHGALCLGWYDAIVQRVKKDTVDIRYNADGKAVKGVPISVEMRGAKGLSNVCTLVKAASPDPILSSSNPLQRLGSNGGCISERVAEATTVALKESSKLKEAMRSRNLDKDALGSLVAAKYGASLCAPGEAVGSIAAQSVGEPSTQMTLNTFHLAGAGANVTLGIPRLREIIMTASRELKTPTMSAPLHEHVSDKDAVRLTRYFQRLNLIELIAGHHGIAVDESIVETGAGNWERAYSVRLKFHPAERIKEAFDLTLDDIAEVVAKTFVPALSREMKLELRRSAAEGESSNLDVGGGEAAMYQRPSKNSKKTSDDDDAQESSGLRDSSATPDLFGDDDDDADESDNEAGEEDGVAETRTQAEGYGAADEDEKVNEADNASMSDASSRQEKQDDDDYDDDDEVGAEMTASSAYSNELKVDEKRNSLVLPTLRVDPSARPLLMVGLVEKAAQKTIVRARKSIDQAFVNTEENGRGRCLQTAGINFTEMWELDSIDHDRLMSNDIWAVRCAYGVEAARNTIVDQIRSVFGAYGIEVDARHLSLIADYMTYGGDYTAMNRIGMRDAMSSPFLQMSFETTAQFLTQAAVATRSDSVKSPSSNIVVGRPIRHGTGAFSLLAK
jgi:DNA-directed RNA polymerase I subunit RPA1